MDKAYKLSLQITKEEMEYLKELLSSEVFQLSGLSQVKQDSDLKEELRLAQVLEEKFEKIELQAA